MINNKIIMYIRNEYPHPQFKRSEWQGLNGPWEFCFDDDNIGLVNKYYDGKASFVVMCLFVQKD